MSLLGLADEWVAEAETLEAKPKPFDPPPSWWLDRERARVLRWCALRLTQEVQTTNVLTHFGLK